MVLPAPAPDDPEDPEAAGWAERIRRLLQLGRRGILILVDRADGARLRELFLALLPDHPDLELYTDPRALVELPEGTTLVLAPGAEHADWLNINRPIFAARALRVVLWCDAETSKALARRATDFFDWISHRVECPPGVPAFAVAGLRCALLSRALGVIWAGQNLEAAFRLAFPKRRLVWLSAKASYGGLEYSIESHGPDWLAFIDIDSEQRLKLVRFLLEIKAVRTRVILVEPGARIPGCRVVHARLATLSEARSKLLQSGVTRPGRMVALSDSEPESIILAKMMVESGIHEQKIEAMLRTRGDAGAALARLTLKGKRNLVEAAATAGAIPPLIRAFWKRPDVRRRRVLTWLTADEHSSGRVEELSNEMTDLFENDGSSALNLIIGSINESVASLPAEQLTATGTKLRATLAVLEQGAPERDPFYAVGLHALAMILAERADFEQAETLLRRSLLIFEATLAPDMAFLSLLITLQQVLLAQGRPGEAEPYAIRALQIARKTNEPLQMLTALCNIADVERALGKEEAIATALQALELLPKAFPPDDPALAQYAARLDGILSTIHLRA